MAGAAGANPLAWAAGGPARRVHLDPARPALDLRPRRHPRRAARRIRRRRLDHHRPDRRPDADRPGGGLDGPGLWAAARADGRGLRLRGDLDHPPALAEPADVPDSSVLWRSGVWLLRA